MTKGEIIKKRYPFYDENLSIKDVELNGEQVQNLMQEYADSEVKKLQQAHVSGMLVCPFCGEVDFDKEGLKYHLETYCNEYQQTNYR